MIDTRLLRAVTESQRGEWGVKQCLATGQGENNEAIVLRAGDPVVLLGRRTRKTSGSVASCQTTSTLRSFPERIASTDLSGLFMGIPTAFKVNFSAGGAAVCCVPCGFEVKIR